MMRSPRFPVLRRLGASLTGFGFDFRRTASSIAFVPTFLKGSAVLLRNLKKLREEQFRIRLVPMLSDAYLQGGVASGHYFHQDLWAARRIYIARPDRHIDVGSRIDGFVAHLLVFMDVTVLDVRPVESKVDGLSFCQADMMYRDDRTPLSAESVSCLHALEHFGLGRYGDPFELDGWKKGLARLSSLLEPGGNLYLSVPIGVQAVEFNAHRIFFPHTIVNLASTVDLRLTEFSYVDDQGDFHEKVPLEEYSKCDYGCGCFVFTRTRDRI